MLLESKHYYIDLINSSKANKFTSYYHYSGVGFKRAEVNQGIYRKEDDQLVGVLQWGTSAQMKIRLDRYVKEPIEHKEYLELNRFCMADSEGKNAESEAISLGIKWIKQNRKDIRLLVSYAGRKEGNYGYIYQATNWEYLGYFISPGFWIVDGKEKHQISLWSYYKRHCDQTKGFKEGLCEVYHQVKHFDSKQFIYIKRLDKKLTPASPILPYPKPSNEYPIVTKLEVLKDEPFEAVEEIKEEPVFFYEKEELLFSRRALIRRGEIAPDRIACYVYGNLEQTLSSVAEVVEEYQLPLASVKKSLAGIKDVKQYAFRWYPGHLSPAAEIDLQGVVAEVDNIKFFNQSDVANYCGVSRQAVSISRKRNSKTINGKEVFWKEKN